MTSYKYGYSGDIQWAGEIAVSFRTSLATDLDRNEVTTAVHDYRTRVEEEEEEKKEKEKQEEQRTRKQHAPSRELYVAQALVLSALFIVHHGP